MMQTINAAIQLGSILDGPIKFPAHGKFAALKTADGHMIGLYEPVQV